MAGSDPITPPQPITAPGSSPGSNMTADGRQGLPTGAGFGVTTSGAATADRPAGQAGGLIDITGGYPWTLSKKKGRDDIPEIILQEHRNEESAIMRQVAFYSQGIGDTLGGAFTQSKGYFNGTLSKDLLKVYQDIFPDNPTGNVYYMPYFSKTFLELNSPQWEQLDDIGASIDNTLEGVGDFAKNMGNMIGGGFEAAGDTVNRFMEGAASVRRAGAAAFETALKLAYPVVGVFDRPRIFSSHNEREVKVEFPLYNTINLTDWKANRDLVYQMMTQYLYIKNSYITGYPPVFYRVLIPGEYFSFASCVTNFSVTNLGNIRKLYGFNVPDAYQFSITLKEMCMPSLNQFQAMTSGEAADIMKLATGSGQAFGSRGRIP